MHASAWVHGGRWTVWVIDSVCTLEYWLTHVRWSHQKDIAWNPETFIQASGERRLSGFAASVRARSTPSRRPSFVFQKFLLTEFWVDISRYIIYTCVCVDVPSSDGTSLMPLALPANLWGHSAQCRWHISREQTMYCPKWSSDFNNLECNKYWSCEHIIGRARVSYPLPLKSTRPSSLPMWTFCKGASVD